MSIHSIWAWAVKNITCVSLWVLLAVRFEKWWIALFSILFLSDLKARPEYRFICDKCGAHSPTGKTYDEAEQLRKEAGWERRKRGGIWEDICPDCQKQEETDHE